MQYYDVKELTVKIKNAGTMTTSFSNPSLGFKRPISEFEAQKMCTEFIMKKYPKCTILDMKIEYK